MTDINKVVLVGRLTRDAELTYTPSGFAITKFALASNYSRKVNEQWTEEVSYFDVVAWGRRGEALMPYLHRGQQVAVEGHLKQERWEKDGNKRSRVIIESNIIQLLGSKDGNQASHQVPPQQPPRPQQQPLPPDPAGRTPNSPAPQHMGGGPPGNSQNFESDIPF